MNLEALRFLRLFLDDITVPVAPLAVDEWQPYAADNIQNHLVTLADALYLSYWQMHATCGTLL